MNRLIEKTVFCGFVTAWRLATWPTSRSPSLVKPTTEGVVRPPSALGITTGSPPSITETTEFVVPRSIPITLSAIRYFSSRAKRPGSDIANPASFPEQARGRISLPYRRIYRGNRMAEAPQVARLTRLCHLGARREERRGKRDAGSGKRKEAKLPVRSPRKASWHRLSNRFPLPASRFP